ncbi:MAG: peptidoglycan DD-metalloendopeptidase family protein [Clostridiales bacterium]|nr:peptidoglycan DD-metalloendopeptidase family protein [Clostridiales bacterium]
MLTICLLLLWGASVPAYAETETPTQSDEELRASLQSQIEEADRKLDALRSESDVTEDLLIALDKKIDLVQQEIDVMEELERAYQAELDQMEEEIEQIQLNIDAMETEIDALEVKIAENQAEFDLLYEEYSQRLRAIYISGTYTNLEVLLSSSDMSALLTRLEMISLISEQDSRALGELVDMMEEIKDQENRLQEAVIQLETDKEDIEEGRVSVLSYKEIVDEILEEIGTKKAQLDQERSEANAALKELHAETQMYSEYMYQSQDELNRMNGIIDDTISNSTGSTAVGTGVFTHPCPNYSRISATFPRYSNGSSHTGVNFAAPTGTAIYAADTGTVIAVRYLNYSYGYHLYIDHGNGLVTIYAHCSSMSVYKGKIVKKGDRIARVGSTGNSTGPHLHFEVRKNGTAVYPMIYLP